MIFSPRKSRRQFLVGTGKFLLAMPFLPSLAPRNAWAGVGKKKFVALLMPNGVRYEHWNPTLAANQAAPGVNFRSLADYQGTGINQIIDSSYAPLYGKMNFFKGLDTPIAPSHNDCDAPLGNFNKTAYWETIDQVMAKSSSFYQNEVPALPSLNISLAGLSGTSRAFSRGELIKLPAYNNPVAVFNRIFFTANLADQNKQLKVVDRALASYRSTLTNPKLSSEDKLRMQEFIDYLNQTENRIRNQRALTVAKPSAPPSWDSASTRDSYQILNDLAVLALEAEATQVIVMHIHPIPRPSENTTKGGFQDYTGLDTRGTWHEDHHVPETVNMANANDKDKQSISNILTYNRWHAKNVVFDIVNKMNSKMEGNGKSILDNSLVLWSNELGMGADLHDGINMPVVTFGSAGGSFATGRFLDYSQMSYPAGSALGLGSLDVRPGRLYNQLLVSILKTMGLQPSDYERGGKKGYGELLSLKPEKNALYAAVRAEADQFLPKWTG